MTSNWISTSEAAAILDVNRITVWRWVREGRLKVAARLGGPKVENYFDRAYIEEVAKNRNAPKQAEAIAS